MVLFDTRADLRYPTFDIGDQLAVEKVSKYFRPYQRTDVVVFRAPPAFAEYVDESKANEDLIKRIVGVAGFFFFLLRCVLFRFVWAGPKIVDRVFIPYQAHCWARRFFRFSFFVGWS
jgi:hypothetical protein